MTEATEVTHVNRLKKNSLGVGSVTFLVISAAAPLAAIAGGGALGMLMGNGAGFAATYVVVTAMLLVFSVGYVAMSKHVANAGAFYAYTAKGLGGIAGGATAVIAILSYNMMQIGILGLLGAATGGLFSSFGVDLPWWVWSFVAIALVAVLGYRQVELSAKILVILVLLEYAVLLVLNLLIIGKGGESGLNMQPFSTSQFFTGSVGIALLFAFQTFVGFEATTIYSEEARDPERTIPRATYFSVLLVGVFYTLTAWAMAMGAGVDKLVPTLQSLQDPTVFLFTLSDRYAGTAVTQAMNILFISSLFAAVVAFHNSVARYMYVSGREKLLPSWMGVTHPVHKSPHVGSVIQTVIAVAVVGFFAFMGLDPIFALFSWLTNVGTLGIIVMMVLTSLSVIAFFRRNPTLASNPLSTLLLPVIAFVALLWVTYTVVVNFGDLSGAGGSLAVILPGLVAVAAGVGALLAVRLKAKDRVAFDSLGQPTV